MQYLFHWYIVSSFSLPNLVNIMTVWSWLYALEEIFWSFTYKWVFHPVFGVKCGTKYFQKFKYIIRNASMLLLSVCDKIPYISCCTFFCVVQLLGRRVVYFTVWQQHNSQRQNVRTDMYVIVSCDNLYIVLSLLYTWIYISSRLWWICLFAAESEFLTAIFYY